MVGAAIPRNLFAGILRLIAELRPPPDPAPAWDVLLSCDRAKSTEEVRVDEDEIDISGAERADITGFGAWPPHDQDPALPILVQCSNLDLCKPVMLVRRGLNLLFHLLQGLYLSAQSSDLLLDPGRAGLSYVALFAIRPVQGCEVALDARVDLLHPLANLGHREVLVAIVHGFELAAVDRNDGLRKQAQSAAQLDELAAHRSDRRAVVSTEVGDGLEVWSQSSRQPYQLNIALSLSLKAAARLEPIKVAVEIDPQQRRWVIGRASGRSGLNAFKAKGSEIKLIDEGFYDPNRVIPGHVVVQRRWQ
jgi:hypothetical protein